MPQTDLDQYTQDAVTRDGRTVHIRPIAPDDLDAMMQMWSRLSLETIRLRFFAPRRMDREQMRHFTEVDYHDRFALIAERGDRILGVARFDRLDEEPQAAEFAVLVEDAEQGQGIGTALLRALLEPAQDLGITNFRGDILRENRRMQNVLKDAGLEPAFRSVEGTVETSFRVVPSETFLRSVDEQDRKAAVAALRSVFAPKSIAVIGASRDVNSIGGLVFDNLRQGRYQGAVYPVNPAADVVQSVAAYPTVADCPSVPDMVIVCVPAEHVTDVITQAAEAGSKAAVVISAGFREIGDEGVERELELLHVTRRYGIRVVGPNCMGVMNAGRDVRMNGTFSRVFPEPGSVAFSSQSGALGLAILSGARRLGLGMSSFISVGNKIDISGNDLIQYWESDDATSVILLYLESFGNPHKFGRIARRVGRTKPIVAVKSGRTRAGAAAASSHTGALAAGDGAVDALFEQAGVIRTETLAELFGVASVLANQPLPAGRGIGILTNGGGPGILAADACEGAGLEIRELTPATQDLLRSFLPREAGVGNPVDMIASASAETYGRAMRAIVADPGIDMLLVIFIPPIVTSPSDVAQAMVQAHADIDPSIPVVTVFMSEEGVPVLLSEAGIPSFGFPEEAVRALGQVAHYSEWRRRPLGHVVEVTDADEQAARAVVDEALVTDDQSWLSAQQTEHLLGAFGIPTARTRRVATPDEAAAAQRDIGGAVAVKLAAPVHKTELEGVRLGLLTAEDTADAVRDMAAKLRAEDRQDLVDHGFLIQEMIGGGLEMAVGVNHDPTFGPVLMVGLGGTLVELLADVSLRIHPLTDHDVDEMLMGLRGYPLLTGYRGSEPLDVLALKNVLFRLSALVEVVPEIAELDLNPVFVHTSGVTAVDARIRVARHVRLPAPRGT
jgi:acetyl coenzyme A synthetase (ADP forming)-like protein